MPKWNPAVRTGLIWAGAHQVWALCGLAAMWYSVTLFSIFGVFLLIADLPVFMLPSGLGLNNWHPPFASELSAHLPVDGRTFAEGIVLVLTLGALQWFLIGYIFEWRRARRSKAI